jgi:hypothetical protein
MKNRRFFEHEFVEFIPDSLQEGIVYVSLTYGTVIHLCACGCRKEVVTPLAPFQWKLTYDGETISLYPSIGNWDFPCQSHYWLREGRIVWASTLSSKQIQAGRQQDSEELLAYFEHHTEQTDTPPVVEEKADLGFWAQAYETFKNLIARLHRSG